MSNKKTGKKGGQYGNKNARKHGAYQTLHFPDRRTREAKVLDQIEATLVSAVGGDPTPQEILLIKRICFKAFRCAAIELEMIGKSGQVSAELEKRYLRWASELRMDVKLLGLKRREKQISDLRTYIAKEYLK